MIVVKLMGGLGNQMFQYAAGKSLALKHKTELFIDLNFLLDRTPHKSLTFREFDLPAFNVSYKIADKSLVTLFLGSKKLLNNWIIKAKKIITNNKFHYYFEPFYHFNPDYNQLSDNYYLEGYFQSEKYFLSIKDHLIKEFVPIKTLSEKTLSLAEKIKTTPSVSIHVRRQDYLSIPENNQLYYTCTAEYYNNAIAIIKRNIINPLFFIFSDEPEWFKNNIKIEYPVEYVTHTIASNSYEDMYLMSLCKHNIIANSSFSWWGAWLNQNSNKIVIAPQNWFNDPKKNTKDSLPDSWIKI